MSDEQCEKKSVSLYASDLRKVNDLIAYMCTRGVHISRSQAIQIAIRRTPIDGGLVDAYEQTTKDDGRRGNQ